jgi:hypothetical protein
MSEFLQSKANLGIEGGGTVRLWCPYCLVGGRSSSIILIYQALGDGLGSPSQSSDPPG